MFCLAILSALSLPAFADDASAPGTHAKVRIDGVIDAAEWQGARHITDFRTTQPLTGAPGSLPTEAWVMATPEGLAVAFRAVQPAGVPRTLQKIQRDEQAQVDRVNLMVDFEGDGRTGYNFMVSASDGINDAVITNQSQFSTDWDGNWQHAASTDGEGWSAEMLIPWYIAPMAKGVDGKRVFRIYLDRVVGATGERMAWPQASFERPRFLSDFAPIELPAYSTALLAITPYASGLYDNVRGDASIDGGADIFWKPNGQFQLTATINPDFGQVESDDLVVNFDANETFFSDKRPFFTENQGLFGFTTPSDNSQLLYTRRVGGDADDGSGPGDITAALKFNGNVGSTKYGMFLAEEGDPVGRSFRALRLVHDFADQNVGAMLTQVEHPYLDRTANVLGVDHDWRPNARWTIRTRVIASDIEQAGQQRARGSGATVWADYEMARGWRQQFMAMHFGDSLEINDFGYLSRNDLNYGHYQVSKRVTDLPADSAFASHDWRARITAKRNDHGLALPYQFRLMRQSQLRDGSSLYGQVNVNSAGVDDRITRGRNPLQLPPNFNAHAEFSRPRKGAWAFDAYANVLSGGLSGNDKIGWSAGVAPTWFANDALSFTLDFSAERLPDWLVWQGDNRVGSFAERSVQLNGAMNWTIDNRQELRVKLQALGLEARARQGWDAQPDGQALASATPVDDFSLRNLGFQVRYRYELAPLSYVYVVYGRGGDMFNEYWQSSGSLLGDAFSLRDAEQLVLKFTYRFEL
ncbi:MAG TPA: DUF5916 domain-containing protein [Pseudoxanthomonas sp.]|nr:DUF5916 domain-containing protein [Pseudoxanthomonas sp.]